LVRDELGNPLTAESAEIILETASGTQIKTQIIPGLRPGVNYNLSVPMDSGITDDLYKPTALRPTVPFKIRVKVGETVFLPIEMKGDYSKMGQPGQRTRLDLTLGEDSDGDGLPDAWERILIALAGGTMSLSDIRPQDDFDGDGLSNLEEYIAGTYAYDNRDGFTLEIVGMNGNLPRLKFMVIRGRSYTVHGSADLQQWVPVEFRVPAEGAQAPIRSSYYATDVRVIQAEVVSPAEQPPMRFFKLMVQ
jgi:hypothetical protein